jgi:hypothetical protein
MTDMPLAPDIRIAGKPIIFTQQIYPSLVIIAHFLKYVAQFFREKDKNKKKESDPCGQLPDIRGNGDFQNHHGMTYQNVNFIFLYFIIEIKKFPDKLPVRES